MSKEERKEYLEDIREWIKDDEVFDIDKIIQTCFVDDDVVLTDKEISDLEDFIADTEMELEEKKEEEERERIRMAREYEEEQEYLLRWFYSQALTAAERRGR